MRTVIFLFSILLAAVIAQPASAATDHVAVRNDHLVLDGTPQPQLFGAELQYFRLRGGYGKNVSRAKVLQLWNQALDRMVEAKMNTISFYIPWDFHEYAEGKFDFTGTADEDHDGNPDYPSRDVLTFFKLIEQHGIHRIMVRPGPYINAEWGFLGFGAIPEWFHDKYPDSHMKTSWGWSTRLYDYHSPDLIRHTQLWFSRLYQDVLKDKMGPQKPIVFLQLDNETNYQWQSIYNHDYGPRSVSSYQQFLKNKYTTLEALNLAHRRQWKDWTQVQPPKSPEQNYFEDQDWYRFSDYSMFTFLGDVRNLWQGLGVKEPDVLFTLAESYNATDHGVLPHFSYRNARGTTGMMTVNLYPKTDEYQHPFLNNPFKADLDVKSADIANDSYFGSHQEWVLGPEIQAGWWRGIPVAPAARLQTYLTVLGHGLKSFYVYYFNEGQNWDVDWAYKKTLPILQQLRKEWGVENIPLDKLTNEFWGEMQARSDRLVLVGLDVRKLLQQAPLENKDLYFDAPLDGEAQPRSHFYQLKMLGEKLIFPYQDFLARSTRVEDDVNLIKDSESHTPSLLPGISSVTASSDWTGGLLGSLMNADINPTIRIGEISAPSEYSGKVLVHLDTGTNAPQTLQRVQEAVSRGQWLVNFIASTAVEAVGVHIPGTPTLLLGSQADDEEYTYYLNKQGHLVSGTEPDAIATTFRASAPLFTYPSVTQNQSGCMAILYWRGQPAGYKCERKDFHVVQLGVHFFKSYNSGFYGQFDSSSQQRQLLKAIFKEASVEPVLELSANAKFTVAFARKDPKKELFWITVKTGLNQSQSLKLKMSSAVLSSSLPASSRFRVREPLSGLSQEISRQDLTQGGVSFQLAPMGALVLVVEGL